MSTLMASFSNEATLVNALDRLRAEGFAGIETYTPTPIQDLRPHWPSVWVPAGIFAGGIGGAIFILCLQTLATASDWGYPVDIGGRPKFSWPAYMPTTLAFGLLCAALAALALHLMISPLWRLWDPVDEFVELRGASRDRWVVEVHGESEVDLLHAGAVLAPLQPIAIRTIPPQLLETPV